MRKTTPWFKCLTPEHPVMISLVSDLGPEAYLYLAQLLSLVNQVGAFELTPQILAQHCRLNSQKVKRIFEKISKKFQESLEILEDSSEKLEENSKNLEESSKILPTLGVENPRGSIKERKTDKTDQTEEKETPPKFSDADLQTAKFIFDGVKRHDPKAKEPNFTTWADDVRLMREKDKRTDDEIRQVFTWANNDQFWRKNILSPGKLRDKFSRLVIGKNDSPTTRGGSVPGNKITPAEQRTAGVVKF